jgi:hypothetical protein
MFMPHASLLIYLLIDVIVMDLLVPLEESLPPPTGPCWTYEPHQITTPQFRSTQLAKTLAYVEFFGLEQQASNMLPRLQYFKIEQARNETTDQVFEQWKNVWGRWAPKTI